MDSNHYFYSDGLKLAASLHQPDQPTGELRPGIVLAQGLAGQKEKYRFPEYFARRFVEAGFVALCFEYRGFGDAEGIRRRLVPLERVADTRNAVTFLQQQAGVDPNRIGLFAISYGGAIGAFTAAIDPRVKCFVSVNGIGNGERWLRSLRRLHEWGDHLKRLEADRAQRVLTGKFTYVDSSEEITPVSPAVAEGRKRMIAVTPPGVKWEYGEMTLDSSEAVIEFKPEDLLAFVSPRAVMFVHGTEDTIVSIEESLSMYEKSREPKRLLIVPGARHHDIYLDETGDYVVAETIAWFAEHLKTVPADAEIRAAQRGLPIAGLF